MAVHVLKSLTSILMLCLSFGRDTDALNMEISPDTFTPLTPKVQISCKSDDLKNIAQEILSMSISKDQTQIASIHQSSLQNPQGVLTNDLIVKSHLDKDVEKTYIDITLRYPSNYSSGKYECSAYYVDIDKNLKSDFSERNLTFLEADSTTVINAIRALERRVESSTEIETKILQRMASMQNNLTTAIRTLEATQESKVRNLQSQVNSLETRIFRKMASLDTEIQEHRNETNKMMEMEDVKNESVFSVMMKFTEKLKEGKNVICGFHSHIIKSKYFDEKDCSYTTPVAGVYSVGGYMSQVGVGKLHLYVMFGEDDWHKVTQTHTDNTIARGMTLIYFGAGTKIRLGVEREGVAEVYKHVNFDGYLI